MAAERYPRPGRVVHVGRLPGLRGRRPRRDRNPRRNDTPRPSGPARPPDGGFGIARGLCALSDPPIVILTSSTDRTRFGAQLDGHVFIAKADVSSAAVAELTRSPETGSLESRNP